MGRYASLYRRGSMWFAHPCNGYEGRALQAAEPFLATTGEAGPTAVARMLRLALGESRDDIEDLERRDTLAPMYGILGVRSWRAFAKAVTYVEVRAGNDTLTLKPQLLVEPKCYFTGIPGADITIPASATDDELGLAVLEAFARIG